MNLQDFYKYSWFSTLAYVDWRKHSGLTVQAALNNSDPIYPQAIRGGDDTLEGGDGSDTHDSGAGNDTDHSLGDYLVVANDRLYREAA